MSDSEYDSSPVRVEVPQPRKKATKRKTTSASTAEKTPTASTSIGASLDRKIKKRKADLFAIIRAEEALNSAAPERAASSSSTSSFTARVSSGQVRRTVALDGKFYIDIKIYNTSDWLGYKPEERYKKALTSIKLQTDVDTPEWESIQKFLGQAFGRFENSDPVFFKESK